MTRLDFLWLEQQAFPIPFRYSRKHFRKQHTPEKKKLVSSNNSE
jgi:hypothetical protein